jgi:hypothetical protein
MSALRDLVVELVETHRVLGALALEARIDPTRRPEVVRLRKRSAEAVQRVIAAIDEDGQLQADPELARQFRDKFSEMRARIAIFQAKWPAVLLGHDDDKFVSDREQLRALDKPVTDWALLVLR